MDSKPRGFQPEPKRHLRRCRRKLSGKVTHGSMPGIYAGSVASPYLGVGSDTWSSHDRCSGCLIRPGRPGRIRTQGSLQGTSPEKQDTPQGLRFHQVRVAGAILFSVAAVPTVRGESHRSLHGCQAETISSQNPMDSAEISFSQKGGKRGSHGLLSGRITFGGL